MQEVTDQLLGALLDLSHLVLDTQQGAWEQGEGSSGGEQGARNKEEGASRREQG